MKRHTKLLIFVAMLLCAIGLISTNSKTVQATYLNGNDYTDMCKRYVKVVKTVKVYKVRTGTCEANNHFKYYGKLKKGSHVWISRWLMSTGGGWVIINDGKYYSTRRTFFFAVNPHGYNRANWYKRIA
ncbi:hypothetical protein DM298_05700 [Lactobacillus amylovorus]|uniref:Uncharacterized protein n=1 Tax=Lactobacillus amylovorus TaxID=1604 RepID=A0A5B8EDA6_LACAM|nr:hypothetical protein [Lactobacillus amylovorus]QDD70405.1 hypothetical protein DM298_05700 [Lactobacillus amylovorus]